MDDQQEFYAHELMQERYRENVAALNRCARAGVSIDDVKRLAFECGVDIKHTILGDEIRPRRVA